MKQLLLIFVLTLSNLNAQTSKINWLSFEQLEDSLATKPKKVFVNFHANWCSYCKKMEKVTFRDSTVTSVLNTRYYAVKMNAESTDTIVFDGVSYINQEIGKQRRSKHQIPLLLASKKNKKFSLPVSLILDESFKVKERYYEYLSPKKLLQILTN